MSNIMIQVSQIKWYIVELHNIYTVPPKSLGSLGNFLVFHGTTHEVSLNRKYDKCRPQAF